MRLHVHKKAIRALGISESFFKGLSRESVLAGVVMRTDFIIDGFIFSKVTVGGTDATEKIVKMYNGLGRKDINLLILNGCIISWYNVIDLHRVSQETGLPLLCVTYEESEGLEKYFMELFPNDWEYRINIYHKNLSREKILLKNGQTVYIRPIKMNMEEAKVILNKFTLNGSIPEPLRIARQLAHSILKNFEV